MSPQSKRDRKRQQSKAYALKVRLMDALLSDETAAEIQFSGQDIAELLVWEERLFWAKVQTLIMCFKHFPTLFGSGENAMNELRKAIYDHFKTNYWKEEEE